MTHPNSLDLETASPDQLLLLAATLGRTDLAVSALNAGANINARVSDPQNPGITRTALHASVQNVHVDVTRALLSASADLQIQDSNGRNPLFYLPPQSESPEIHTVFSADLCQKAAQGDLNAVSRALEAGLDPNVTDSPELANTPLHWAASFGASACVRALLDAGASVDPVNHAGLTPLLDAALAGHADVVSVLVAANADLFVTDPSNKSLSELPLSPNVRSALGFTGGLRPPLFSEVQQAAEPDSPRRSSLSHAPLTPKIQKSDTQHPDAPNIPDWAPVLWPPPQRFVLAGGSFTLPPILTISAENACLSVARLFYQWLLDSPQLQQADTTIRLVGGGQGGLGEPIAFSAAIFLRIDKYALERGEQAYSITVRDFGVDVVASDSPGLFYACSTLVNMITLCMASSEDPTAPPTIPTLSVSDWPSVRNRGLFIDISRQRIPNLNTLKDLVKFMSKQTRLNQLHLRVTNNFDRLKGISREAMFRHEDILELNEWCQEHFVDLIPVIEEQCGPATSDSELQADLNGREPLRNSTHPREERDESDDEMLFDEFLPLFNSEQVSLVRRERKGCKTVPNFSRMRSLLRTLRTRGKRAMLVYGNHVPDALTDKDIAPTLLPELPSKMILVVQAEDGARYGVQERCSLLQRHGLPFYICLTSFLEDTITGRLSTFLKRTKEAINAASSHGAVGVVLKDSSMCSKGAPMVFLHQLMVAFGGASWNEHRVIEVGSEGPDAKFSQLLDVYLFKDSVQKGVLGNICLAMADMCKLAGDHTEWTLQDILSFRPEKVQGVAHELSSTGLRKIVKQVDRMDSVLAAYKGMAERADVAELRMAGIFLLVAARIGASFLQTIIDEEISESDRLHDDLNRGNPLGLHSLSDGRRSDLCNQLLQGIELMREAWMLRYHKTAFVKAVEETCGKVLRTLADGMPYQGYLDELVGQLIS